MSKSLNEVRLIGHTGNTPEVRTTGTGTKVARFTLATNYKQKDGTEGVDWHRVTAFGNLADIVEQYVGKGHRLYIAGRISYSTSEHEGTTRYYTDINADEMIMLDGKTEPF